MVDSDSENDDFGNAATPEPVADTPVSNADVAADKDEEMRENRPAEDEDEDEVRPRQPTRQRKQPRLIADDDDDEDEDEDEDIAGQRNGTAPTSTNRIPSDDDDE